MKTKAQDCLFFDHHAVAGLLTGHASPAVGRPPAAKRLEVSFRGERCAAGGIRLQRLCLDDPIAGRLMLRILAVQISAAYELKTGDHSLSE